MAKDETIIEGEVVGEEEVKTEEKKENGFKRLWNKTKQSVNDAVLESKIESAYHKAHSQFSAYKKDEMFSSGFFGEIVGDSLIVFGEYKNYVKAILIDDKTSVAYWITAEEPTTVKSAVEGVEYERPGTKFTLDKNVTEVKVVKAGKRYFLYEE